MNFSHVCKKRKVQENEEVSKRRTEMYTDDISDFYIKKNVINKYHRKTYFFSFFLELKYTRCFQLKVDDKKNVFTRKVK